VTEGADEHNNPLCLLALVLGRLLAKRLGLHIFYFPILLSWPYLPCQQLDNSCLVPHLAVAMPGPCSSQGPIT